MSETISIEDLLQALQNPDKVDKVNLENNKETWTRIGNKDTFSELELESGELDSFLKEWTENNDYNNI